MKVSLGSDHRGIEQRQLIAGVVRDAGHEVDDCGTHTTDSCDYPDIAASVARQVALQQTDRGILICGTGIGVSIAANKINGIRAAVCHDTHTVEMSRRHNDANILCISAMLGEPQMREMVKLWLTTPFDGERHQRRVQKIKELECSPSTG